ncbi:MAG: chloride channel protein [Eubacterium sp.]|nr:chloride channel protein [Eubacterium sp.]
MFGKKAKSPKPTKEEKKDRKIPISKYSVGGRMSCVIAALVLILMLIIVAISIATEGNVGMFIGLFVLGAFGGAVFGFVIGINSFAEENKFMKYSYIGTIANAIIAIWIFSMYLTYI